MTLVASRSWSRSGLSRLWYDNNLLNMQAEGLESVALEKKLLAECNQSVWYALSIADSREELLARKAQFLQLASVERTEEIVSLLPVDRRSQAADHRAHSSSGWRRCPNGRR